MASQLKSPMQSSKLANKADFDVAIVRLMDIALSANNCLAYDQMCQLLRIAGINRGTLTRDYRAFALDGIRTLLYHDHRALFNAFGEFSVPRDDVGIVRFMLALTPNTNDPDAFKQMIENQRIQDCRSIFVDDSKYQDEPSIITRDPLLPETIPLATPAKPRGDPLPAPPIGQSSASAADAETDFM